MTTNTDHPSPGFDRRGRSRVEIARTTRTAAEHRAAQDLLGAMLAMDGHARFEQIAEIIVERLADQHKDIYADATFARRLDRLTDHLANVVEAMSEIIADREAALTEDETLDRLDRAGWDSVLEIACRRAAVAAEAFVAGMDKADAQPPIPLAVLGQGEYTREVMP